MRKKLMMIIFTLMAACAFAKAYPSKNINMVVPFSAGKSYGKRAWYFSSYR